MDGMAEFEVDPSEHTLMLFGKVDRCLRVLEQVTPSSFRVSRALHRVQVNGRS